MLRCGAANASLMSITREEVAKIASLARISMDDAELDRMVPELNNILGWVEQLGEVDTSQVEPMTAVIPQAMRLRDDVAMVPLLDAERVTTELAWPEGRGTPAIARLVRTATRVVAAEVEAGT